MARNAVKRSKLASDNEEYSPTKRAKTSSVPRYLTRHSTRRTRSQSSRPYTRDPNNSDDSDGLVTTATGLRNNSGLVKKDYYMTGGLSEGAPKWKSKHQNAAQDSNTESVDNSTTVSEAPTGEISGENGEKGKQPEVLVPDSQTATQAAQEPAMTNGKRESPVAETSQEKGDAVSQGNSDTSTSSKRHKSSHPQPKRTLSAVVESNETGLSINSDDVDDFQPNDESTPFVFPKSRAALQSTVSSSPPSSNSLISKESRERNLASPDVQVPSSPPALSGDVIHSSPPEDEDDQEAQASEPELPPLPPVQRSITPAEQPSWMAPPASSSSPIKSPKAKRVNASTLANLRDPKSLSTAALQSLLPKRRPHAQRSTPDEFDIPAEDSGDASGESASEDELSYHPTRRFTNKDTRKTKKSLLNATNAKPNAKVTKETDEAPKRKQTIQVTKPKQLSKITPLKPATSTTTLTTTIDDSLDRPPSASSNKENRTKPLISPPLSIPSTTTDQSLEQESPSRMTHPLPPKSPMPNKVIKKLAKKFKEVDDWSLDFEEGSLEHSSDRGKR